MESSSETQGQSVGPFLQARLTAPGSPRMLWSMLEIGLTAVDDLILTSQPALASSLHVDLLFTNVSLVNFQISLSKM